MRFKTLPEHNNKHLMDLVPSQEGQYQINDKASLYKHRWNTRQVFTQQLNIFTHSLVQWKVGDFLFVAAHPYDRVSTQTFGLFLFFLSFHLRSQKVSWDIEIPQVGLSDGCQNCLPIQILLQCHNIQGFCFCYHISKSFTTNCALYCWIEEFTYL